MSLQMLQKLAPTDRFDETSEVANVDEDMEASKENRVVNLHLPSSVSPSKSLSRPKQRTPQKRVSSDHALQAAKRMREQDNALSAKIIQNLQSDKAALALKMEEVHNSMTTTKQRCAGLENTAATLATANERLETANQALQEEVEQQANTISELQAQLLKERTTRPAAQDASDVELLHLAKCYLKQQLLLRGTKDSHIKPVDKNNWQSDSLVAQCNGCSKKFGTFLRRHHCRGCGKLFCAACCQDNLHLLSDSTGTAVLGVTESMAQLSASEDYKGGSSGPRQRSCKACFKQAESMEARKQHLQEQTKAGLRAMEDWLAQSGVNLEEILADEKAE